VTLTAKHLEAFDAVVDTILPAVAGDSPAWTTPGRDLGLSAKLPRVYENLPHGSDRAQLRLLLGMLGSRSGGLALFGRPKAFTDLTAAQRANAFRAMTRSRVEMVRRGVGSLKTLAALLWVSTDDPTTPMPAWEAMGYPGPDGPPPETGRGIATEDVTGDTTLHADVVVVGSGAGGGTVAGVLASAGFDVVVLERGGYHDESDFTHLEVDAYQRMYRDAALGTTADGGMLLLAGSTLGGGTVINYSTAFPTPAGLRDEWDREAGFQGVFTGDRFAQSVEAVGSRFGVEPWDGEPSRRDGLMEEGLRSLGWHVAPLPRNAQGCTRGDCGYCTMGCRIGAKKSTLLTYLADATASGARIFTGAEVERVLVDGATAIGVVARVGRHTVRVRARATVLAAGALDTPAILLRSGLGGPAAGRNLHLHPVTALWGRFEERVEPWSGILQGRYSDQHADLDGYGYGFKFETAPLHPLFPSAFIGWEEGAAFKRDVLSLGHTNVVGILLRDRDAGRVLVRRDGTPVIRYRISKDDQGHVRVGVRRAAELLAAEGAQEVVTSANRPVRWSVGDGDIDRFMALSDSVGYGPHRTSYFSFHQMSSARMGSDPKSSVVDSHNRVHGTPGLYVMDASCFPTASGVNPMLTIAAIAHRGATLLAEQMT
jgi:long-chain-alcohol oxidase